VSTEAPLDLIASDEARASRSPQVPRGTLPSLAVLALVMFASYIGLGQVLLPNQLTLIDEPHKVANLALISTASFVSTLLTQPIIGTFSDRTRSRLGRRAPWMIIGAAIGALLLVGISSLSSVIWVAVFWIILQVSLNSVQGPMTALIPDRYPRSKRGVASAMFGLGTTLGLALGVVVAGQLAFSLGVAYTVFGIAILIAVLLFVLINRDYSSKNLEREPLTVKSFFAGLWISPRKYPDFAWAFAARFLFILGYFMVFFFELFILTDYIGQELGEANKSIGLLALSALGTTVIGVLLGGAWSDRISRRKIFVYVASVFVAVGFVVPLVMPTFTGMVIMSLISGVGFGLYTACDTALMTEVLPKDGASAGKDLGILNIATNLPQALSTAIAGVLIASLGYPAIFIVGMIAVVLGAVALVPVKGVR
jgi:MFS family permease